MAGFAACLLAASCIRQEAPRVLPQEQFAALYARLARASVSSSEAGADTARARGRAEEILRQEGVGRADLDATVRWYNEDVTRWQGFYDRVLAAMGDSLGR